MIWHCNIFVPGVKPIDESAEIQCKQKMGWDYSTIYKVNSHGEKKRHFKKSPICKLELNN